MKKVRDILFFAILVAYMVMVSGFIGIREQDRKISALKIRITDSTENKFIHTNQIRNLLEQKKYNPFGKKYSAIDLAGIERSLKAQQIISKAEAFITEPGILHVELSQKVPFFRVINQYGQGYFLDKQGNIIPLASGFSPFVLVANGYIAEPFTVGQTLNINDVKHDSLPASRHVIYDVFRVAGFIAGNKFWNAQIEQIYVNSSYEFELIPRVGSQIIELGKADNMEEKFDNLKLLYLQGFNKLGWNQYGKISLKYKNQVVCTKIQ